MSVKERRERQKQAVRESLLTAAGKIAREEGWSAVTIRRVAEVIEYTPPIIYEYFANKAALLGELQAQGFALLAAAVRKAGAQETNANERILRLSDVYISFAYDQPELYQLMHGWNSAEVSLDQTLSGATLIADIVQNSFESWASEQQVVLPDPAAAVEIGWGLLHGLISIEMLGRIGGGEERVKLLGRQAMRDLLNAWAAK